MTEVRSMTDNLERRCRKSGCGALERIGNPCTDWDCPQIHVAASDYRRLQEALAAAEAERDRLIEKGCDYWSTDAANLASECTDLAAKLASLPALLAETRKKAMEEAARAAYAFPSCVLGALQTDEDGMLLPGSPYDRGRYEAYRAIRSLSNEETPK